MPAMRFGVIVTGKIDRSRSTIGRMRPSSSALRIASMPVVPGGTGFRAPGAVTSMKLRLAPSLASAEYGTSYAGKRTTPSGSTEIAGDAGADGAADTAAD